jgi:Tfp pilus assembly protein PilO
MNNGTISQFVLVILAIGIGMGYVKPAWEEIGVVQDEIYDIDQALENAERNNQELRQLIAAADSIDDRSLEQLDAFLPPEIDLLQSMADMATIADESNVTIVTIAALDNEEASPIVLQGEDESVIPLQTSDIEVIVAGSYEDFKTFLENLERNHNFFEVTSLSFGNTENQIVNDEDPVSVTGPYSLNVRTYAYQSAASNQPSE